MPTAPSNTPPARSVDRRLVVLLFTDVVSSSQLKESIGTAAYLPLLERHNVLFETGIAETPGAEIIKHTGDGYFATFPTASDAARFALVFQSRMALEPWGETALTTRLGIHLGEVALVEIHGRRDVIGQAADLAARVMSLALPGQILLTEQAFNDARQFLAASPEQLAGCPPLEWLAHGRYEFKGRDAPLDVFEVGIANASPLTPPPDAEKVHRTVIPSDDEVLGWRPAAGQAVPGRPGWVLRRQVGHSASGEAWLASREPLDMRHVFKFVFEAKCVAALRNEVAMLKHVRGLLGERRDVAALCDAQLDEVPFFLESEYTDDGNLRDWAESHGGLDRVPPETRLALIGGVAETVAAAHAVGVLHQHLRPSNILIYLENGEPKPRVAEFGLASVDGVSDGGASTPADAENADAVRLRSDVRHSTRVYEAPGMLADQQPTLQGDVYTLGVLLYQMVIGSFARPPMQGWERNVSDALLRDDIGACIDRDPDQQLASAGVLASRLRNLPARRAAKAAEGQRAVAATRKRLLWKRAIVALVVLQSLLIIALLAWMLLRGAAPNLTPAGGR